MKKGVSTGFVTLVMLLLAVRMFGQATAADTTRIISLIDTAWAVYETQSVRAEKDLREAIGLSQQIPYPKGEASAWNALGAVEEVRGNITLAFQYYEKALQLRESLGDKRGMASLYNNLGLAYENVGNYDLALEYHRKNLLLVEEMNDNTRIARAQLNIAGALEARGNLNEANEHAYIARQLIETTSDSNSIAAVYNMLGNIRYELDLYSDARIFYEKTLEIRKRMGDSLHIANALNNVGNALDEIGKVKKQPDSTQLALQYYQQALDIKISLDDQPGIASLHINLGDAYKHLGQFRKAMEHLDEAAAIFNSGIGEKPDYIRLYENIADVYAAQKNYRQALEYTTRYFDIAVETGDEKYQQKGYKDFSDIYAKMGNHAKAYEYRVLYDELRYKRLDEARARDFARREVLFSEGRRQALIERQNNEIRLQGAELETNRIIGIALGGIALALILLLTVVFRSNRARARANRELAYKNTLIEQERERADLLLKNILPESVASELKQTNSVKPMRYESVTVMFSDFRNFTRISETVSPEQLVAELDECFQMFDSIIEVCGLEKIKTIGDSYMCAGGVPIPSETHAHDVLKAAIAMQIGLSTLMEQKKQEGKPVFEMRIGIHTGPVVAGVVGSRKFAYDIWGDTVNTAARLEQGSEAGKINISETTYLLVKDQFPCSFRGNLAAKNKGEIAMYFVEY